MGIKSRFLNVFILGLVVLIGGCKFSVKQSGDKKEVIGNKEMVVAYVAGYRDFDFSTIRAENLTHINYAFANIKEGEVIFDTTKIDGKNLTPVDIVTLNGLKSKNPDLKVLVSVGGWTWSGNFSDAALTEESRLKFARSCARFVKTHKLDGIDLDWEYPNQSGAGNVYRPEDVQNFTLMLKAVREQLDAMAKEEGKGTHYLLTIATGADESYVKNTELGKLASYLDFLNIMTYDFYNGWHNVTGHHSNLMPSIKPGQDKNSVVNAVKMHLKAGFPAEKLNVGFPFYGRIWKGVKCDTDDPLFKDAETVGMGIDYLDFQKNIDKNGYRRFWDNTAKAPYLWNREEKIFISYEDEESIALKIKWLKEQRLGGVMYWEYSADYEYRLLNAVVENLN